MKLLLVPTKPAQLNMAAALFQKGGGHDMGFLLASQALDRMNWGSNASLFGLPEPLGTLDTSGYTSAADTLAEGGAQLRETIRSVAGRFKADAVMVFGDLDPVIAEALKVTPEGLPPILCVDGGVRSEAEPSAAWVMQRKAVEGIASQVFTRTQSGIDALRQEGAKGSLHFAGDLGEDIASGLLEIAEQKSTLLAGTPLASGNYAFASIGQKENTTKPERMKALLQSLCRQSARSNMFVLLDAEAVKALQGIDPEWEKTLEASAGSNHIEVVIGGLPALDLARAVKGARYCFTDMVMGQTMARLAGKPCFVPRMKAAWLNDGHAKLVEPDAKLRTGLAVTFRSLRLWPQRTPAKSPATVILETLAGAAAKKSPNPGPGWPSQKP